MVDMAEPKLGFAFTLVVLLVLMVSGRTEPVDEDQVRLTRWSRRIRELVPAMALTVIAGAFRGTRSERRPRPSERPAFARVVGGRLRA